MKPQSQTLKSLKIRDLTVNEVLSVKTFESNKFAYTDDSVVAVSALDLLKILHEFELLQSENKKVKDELLSAYKALSTRQKFSEPQSESTSIPFINLRC